MNGWTPTPRNAERVEYDLNRNERVIATSLAYTEQRNHATTEADADYLHELSKIMDTDPAHILNAQQEPNWDSSDTGQKVSRVTKLPPAKITTMQQFAEAQAVSFNERYYGNNGLPYFPHEKG